MDALSKVLAGIHLQGAVYLDGEFTAPWCAEASYGLPDARQALDTSEHFAFFHFLVEGSCKARLADGDEVVELHAGDLVLFSGDYPHLLGSDLACPAIRTEGLPRDPTASLPVIRYGGGGAVTRFVCGYLAFDRRVSQPLFNSLPRMLRVPVMDDPNAAWLVELLRVGVSESRAQRPGASSLLAKLSELIFVEAMRHYTATLAPGQTGWLAALRDPHVGKALALLHAEPGRAWTVDDLARESALSRSALGERFAQFIGEPPMRYLTRWRLGLAAKALRSGPEAIGRIAERCGYESEAAFNRAFKREFGVPPAAWRRNERAASPH
ncbi:MAG: AraC family transcriptional regulator [Mizugakiibacter sp.]|uniref:AraC family transcriptional regulator n=1 Tax=Mizugakiibacter sp. TaxID=1972610 RepID=UPI0032115FA2